MALRSVLLLGALSVATAYATGYEGMTDASTVAEARDAILANNRASGSLTPFQVGPTLCAFTLPESADPPFVGRGFGVRPDQLAAGARHLQGLRAKCRGSQHLRPPEVRVQAKGASRPAHRCYAQTLLLPVLSVGRLVLLAVASVRAILTDAVLNLFVVFYDYSGLW
jgi:hypothetical protein